MRFPRPLLLAWILAAGLAPGATWAAPRFSNKQVEAAYHVMVGELAALRDQPALAAREFMAALEIVPDAELAMRAASLALVARDEKLALEAAQRWQALAPADSDPREAVTRLALRAGKRGEALKQCEALIAGHAGGPEEGFRQVAQLLSQEASRKDDALAVMDSLLRKHERLPGAWYAQSLLALRFSDYALAERSAREALKLKADSRDARLLLAGVLVKRGAIAEADQVMAALFKEAEDPVELRLGYARLLLEAERVDEARAQFGQVLAAQPSSTEAHFALGLLALEQQDLDAAPGHFRALLDNPALRPRAAYYLGRIEDVQNRPAEAIKWYEQVTEGEPSIDATTRRAVMLGRLGRVDEGRALMARMRGELPAFRTRFWLAEAEVLSDAGRGPEALKLYDQALAEMPDDADLLYGRSLVHEQLKDVKAAEADLRRILARDEDDARAMNALGYMLTVHTDRLDEAHGLVGRALELSPDDAAVIDSMGWIQFRRGKLAEARALLEKAFRKARDPEIAAHLGEVLWTLGDKAEARSVWDAALAREPDHRVLRETIDRLAR